VTKRCTKCGVERELEQFGNNRTYKSGKSTWCKECHRQRSKSYRTNMGPETYRAQRREYCRRWRLANREKLNTYSRNYRKRNKPAGAAVGKSARLKRLYGIDLDMYQQMVIAQNGRCLIGHHLPGKKGLYVDHDHVTGHVRGLLCHLHNRMLGLAHDNERELFLAIGYLRKNRAA